MLSELAGIGWTSNHRLRGVCYLYVRIKWDPDVWPAGFPNIKAVVKGRKPGGTWSENSATCINDYMTSPDGMNIPASKIDASALSAAEAICNQTVTMQGGGSPAPTQKRYTCNGIVSVDSFPLDILEELLTSMSGTMVYQQGVYRIFAGAYVAPTITIDEDNLRAPLTVRPKPGLADRFNAVRGLFAKRSDLWEIRDFPPVTNATYETEDGGQRLFLDLQLPFTDDEVRAQRLAKIILERHRQSILVEFPANMTVHRLAPWDTVNLSIDYLGWTPKVFRVVTWSLAAEGGINLVLQEEASTVYDWTAEETVIDPAPNTTLPSPFTVAAPSGLSMVESLFITRDGSGVKARAAVSWAASAGPFVVAYQVEHRLVGDPDWIIEPRISASPLNIDDIGPGNTEFRVKAINSLEVSSSYSTTLIQEVIALSAAPAAPTGLSLSAIGGMAILRWDPSTEVDVRLGGKWAVRHSKVTSGANWHEAYTIGNAVAGSESQAVLPLKAGTYLLRAIDSAGVRGGIGTITTDQATILAFTDTGTISEHTSSPAFPGTHSNTEVATGNLQIDLSASPPVLTGTYTFSAGFDFGSVLRRRLTTLLTVIILNVTDLIDDRLSLIDTWESFDGDTDGDADAVTEFRETDDDPGGSPVAWSIWKRFDSVEVNARGIEFRIILTTEEAAFNIQISELTVKAASHP